MENEQKIQNFLNKKIVQFVDPSLKKENSRGNSAGSYENTLAFQAFKQEDTIEQSKKHKVIVITVACSDKMAEDTLIYDTLADSLINILDNLATVESSDKIKVCLNIHNDSQKVKVSRNDNINYRIWEQYCHEEVEAADNFFEIEADEQVVEKGTMMDVQMQQAIKRQKIINVVRLLYRLISLAAGIGCLFYTAWHNKQYASDCYAIEGNFWPMYKACPTCNGEFI